MLNFTKWVGTVTSVIGAFILALGFVVSGYSLFIIGSGAWFLVGYKTRDKAMLTLNAFFLAADFIGIFNAIM